MPINLRSGLLTLVLMSAFVLLSPKCSSSLVGQERTPLQIAEQADELYQQSNFESALELVEKAIEAAKGPRVSFQTLRCRILINLRRDNDALNAINEALRIEPEFVPARMERAKLTMRMGMFEQSISDCDIVFESGEPPFEVRGQSRFGINDYIGSLADFTGLIKERSDSGDTSLLAHAHYMRGRSFEAIKVFDLAIDQFNKAYQMKPESTTLLWRARCLRKQERYQESIVGYTGFLDSASDADPYHYLERARAYANSDQFELALADITKAESMSEEDPGVLKVVKQGRQDVQARSDEFDANSKKPTANPFPHNQKLDKFLAQYVMLEGQNKKRDALIAKTLAATPKDGDDAEVQSWIYAVGQQNFQEALKVCDQGLQIQPNHFGLLISRSKLYSQFQKIGAIETEAAIDLTTKDIDQLIELKHPYGYEHRSRLFHSIKSYDRGLVTVSQAMKLTGTPTGEQLSLRGEILFDAKIYDVALSEFEKSAALGYDEPGSRISMGILHSGADQHDKVIEDYTFEINTGVSNPFFWISRGYSYETLGKIDEAIADYKHVLSISQEGSQPNLIVTNSLKAIQPKVDFKSLLSVIEQQDLQAFKNRMDPAFAALIVDWQLKERLAVINYQLKSLDNESWVDFVEGETVGNQKVTIKFKPETPEAATSNLTIYRSDSGSLLGLTFKKGDFQIETLDAIAAPDGLTERTKQFWKAFYAGELQQVYDLLTAGYPDSELKNMSFEAFNKTTTQANAEVLKLFQESKLLKVPHKQIRIAEPVASEDGPAIEIFNLAELDGDRFNACRVRFEWAPDQNKFLMVRYDTGEMDGAYAHRDFEFEEKFFRALVSGDPAQVIALLHPTDQSRPIPEILQAYQKGLHKELGEFKSLSLNETSAISQFNKEVLENKSQGTVIFERGSANFTIDASFGTLDGFTLVTPNANWKSEISDHSRLEQHGIKFLTQLLDGNADKSKKMLPRGFASLTGDQIANYAKPTVDCVGDVQSIVATNKTYDSENEVWKIEFKILGSKAEATGHVSYEFSAWDATIFQFKLNKLPTAPADENESDDKGKDTKEDSAAAKHCP